MPIGRDQCNAVKHKVTNAWQWEMFANTVEFAMFLYLLQRWRRALGAESESDMCKSGSGSAGFREVPASEWPKMIAFTVCTAKRCVEMNRDRPAG
jgi:hypothetical protein